MLLAFVVFLLLLEIKMRRLLFKTDVAVYLLSWCPAGAKTSEEESLPVLTIDAKTASDHLEIKPKSCSARK